MATNNAANNVTAEAGKVLQGAGVGVASTFSTATYPSTAGTSGNVLTSDGTNWTSSSAALPSQLSVATLTLTSQQIKALHATPIQFIAAPGAGKVICLVGNIWAIKFYGGSNVFVAGAAQQIGLYYGTTLSALAAATPYVIQNAQITAGASYIYNQTILAIGPLGTTPSSFQNIALNLYNPVVTEISGNAANDNTITITALYYIATL